MIESLEGRRMLHGASYNPSNQILTITGSVVNDTWEFIRTDGIVTFYPYENNIAEDPEVFVISSLKRIVMYSDQGNDVIKMNGLKVPVYIDAGPGNDTINGGAKNDTLIGDEGNDSIFGQNGNDKLIGGLGADKLRGGAGLSDTADYSAKANDLEITLGSSADDGEDGENDNVGTDLEIVRGGSGDDHISTTSGRAVSFFGGAGNDTLIGGGGADSFNGGIGRDSIRGIGGIDRFSVEDDEIDTVSGGGGNDVLVNSDGNDVLNDI